jgi:hypothetical protein
VEGNTLSKKSKEEKKDEALLWALNKFEKSWSYAVQNLHGTWEENWKLYHNQRTRRKHDGIIETFVPMVNSSINTIQAALYNGVPKVEFIPDTPDQIQDTQVLTEIMDDFAMKDGWAEKNAENGLNTLITGNGPVYYQWCDDRVTKEVIPVRDFIVDPSSTSWRNWKFAGRRYFVTYDQLEKETILDENTGKYVKRYKNLDSVKGMEGSGGYMSDKEVKDADLGQSSMGMSGRIEIVEVWSKKRVVTIAARSVVIEDVENPYLQQEKAIWEAQKLDWETNRQILLMTPFTQETPYGGQDIGEFDEPFKGEGLIPFALARDYVDSSLIYGSSDVDIIKGQQENLNDLKELYTEAILYQNYPERWIDPKYAAYANDLDPKPGKVYPFPQGAMGWNNPPQIPANLFNEIANIKSEIREAIAVDAIVKGVTSATSQTATEIKAQLGQSSQRIELKAKNLEQDFFFQEAKICLKLIKLYMRDKTMVRVLKNTGVAWEEYDPTQFLGEYTPMVKLDITRELERAKDQETAMQAYQIIVQDPTNNLLEAKRIMYKQIMPNLNEEEIEAIITPQGPPAGGGVPSDMTSGNMPPGVPLPPQGEYV